MSELPAVPSPEAPPAAAVKPLWGKGAHILIEFIAIIFWLYALTKLFVFDVDVWLMNFVSPALVWVLAYKFPIVLAALAVAMVTTRSVSLGMAIVYIAFYPFVVFFWKIPRFIWRQQSWLLAFAFINAVISLFRSFKRAFVLKTLYVICALLLLEANAPAILYGAAAGLFLTLGAVYVQAFLKAFKPSAVFQAYTKVFPAFRKSDFWKTDNTYKNLPAEQLTQEQQLARTNNLQNAVIYNRVCLLISKKLRDYQRSKINTISYLGNLIGLLILTVFSFALINFAYFKVHPTAYEMSHGVHGLFTFLYYSAGSMFYATNGLMPVVPASQVLQLIQFLFAVLLLLIFVTVIIATKNERYAVELGEVVDAVEQEGHIIEDRIRDEFNVPDIEDAIQALQTAKAGLIGFILFMSKSLGESGRQIDVE